MRQTSGTFDHCHKDTQGIANALSHFLGDKFRKIIVFQQQALSFVSLFFLKLQINHAQHLSQAQKEPQASFTVFCKQVITKYSHFLACLQHNDNFHMCICQISADVS